MFLDYGEEWEADWAEHVANWEPPSSEDYTPIEEMRKLDYFLTVDELEEEPYSSNVMTVCHYILEEYEEYDEEDENLTDADDWISDGSEIVETPYKSVSLWPCQVLAREADEDGNDIYEVEIFQLTKPGTAPTVWDNKGYRRILKNFTKDAIKFVTVEYMSDQHLPNVFRSSLRIPDSMFPEAWRDLED